MCPLTRTINKMWILLCGYVDVELVVWIQKWIGLAEIIKEASIFCPISTKIKLPQQPAVD